MTLKCAIESQHGVCEICANIVLEIVPVRTDSSVYGWGGGQREQTPPTLM